VERQKQERSRGRSDTVLSWAKRFIAVICLRALRSMRSAQAMFLLARSQTCKYVLALAACPSGLHKKLATVANTLARPGWQLTVQSRPSSPSVNRTRCAERLAWGLVVSGAAHASQPPLSALRGARADGGAAQHGRRSNSREASAPQEAQEADEEPLAQWVFRLLRRPEVTPDIRHKEARSCAAQLRRASTAAYLVVTPEARRGETCSCAA